MYSYISLVNELETIKKEMKKKDRKNIWEYFEPNNGATDDEILIIKEKGIILDDELIAFWKVCNGWNCFYQMVDLFGTNDFDSEKMNYALQLLQIEIGNQNEFNLKQLLPIAASQDDMDIFVIVTSGQQKGKVIWYAGGEIERFNSFREYFEKMINYCREDFNDLC